MPETPPGQVPPSISPPESRTSRRTAFWRRGARRAFMVAVLVALVVFVWRQHSEVTAALSSSSPLVLLGSLLAGVVGAAVPGAVWREFLRGEGYTLTVPQAMRTFFVAQLGKYIPGGVWGLVAQVDMSRDLKVPARQAATATFLTIAVSIISGLLVAGVTVPFAVAGLAHSYWWVFLAVPVLLVLLHPRVVNWWSSLVFRLLRKQVSPVVLPWQTLARTLLLSLVAWIGLGVHFGLLVRGASSAAGSPWLLSTGVFALAWIAGFLVIVAPAGAGVREAALVLGFAGFLPNGAVLTLALLSRFILAAADALLAVLAVAVYRLAGRGGANRARTDDVPRRFDDCRGES